MASGAEFGRLVERAHDGLGVPVEMSQDVGVGDRAGDGRTVFIDEDGGSSHDIAAGASGVGGEDGVAGGAGDALVFKGALLRHSLGQIAGEQGDGVVAAFTVTRELHALFVDEHVDVLEIPGLAEAV